jgi:wobble nucleotide-excising tRNase
MIKSNLIQSVNTTRIKILESVLEEQSKKIDNLEATVSKLEAWQEEQMSKTLNQIFLNGIVRVKYLLKNLLHLKKD